MSTTTIVTQLLLKKAEVEAQIDSLNGRLAEAKADLMHVVGAVRLFDPMAVGRPATAYHGVTKTLRRSEMFALCRAALEGAGEPLDTRQLSRHVITSRGWDSDDKRLALAMAHKVGAMMSRFEKRGIVEKVGLNDKASLWRLVAGR